MHDLAKLHEWSSRYPGWILLLTLITFIPVVISVVLFAWKQFRIYRPDSAALSDFRKGHAQRKRLLKAIDRQRDKVNDARRLNDDLREFISAWGTVIVSLLSATFCGLLVVLGLLVRRELFIFLILLGICFGNIGLFTSQRSAAGRKLPVDR